MFFYEVALQDQSLQLGICDDIFKSGDLFHHLFLTDSQITAALKILAHPVFQADGLAHIDDGVVSIVHDIDTGPGRQLFQFFLYVKHVFLLTASGCKNICLPGNIKEKEVTAMR